MSPALETRPVTLQQASSVSLSEESAPTLESAINAISVRELRDELLERSSGRERDQLMRDFADLDGLEAGLRERVLTATSPEMLDRASTETLDGLADLVARDSAHAEHLKNRLMSLDSTERDSALGELSTLLRARSGDTETLFEAASLLARDPNLDPDARRELEEYMAALAEEVQALREELAWRYVQEARESTGQAVVEPNEELMRMFWRSTVTDGAKLLQSLMEEEDGKGVSTEQAAREQQAEEARERHEDLKRQVEQLVQDAADLRWRIVTTSRGTEGFEGLVDRLRDVTAEIHQLESQMASLKR